MMINSPHMPPLIGTIGLLGSFTLSEVNQLVGISVGIVTLIYLVIRIFKEIKSK